MSSPQNTPAEPPAAADPSPDLVIEADSHSETDSALGDDAYVLFHLAVITSDQSLQRELHHLSEVEYLQLHLRERPPLPRLWRKVFPAK